MTNPLVALVTVICTVFFGFSWALLVGNWLGLSSFDPHRYTVVRELLPLAYGGALLSVAFITALVAVKLHR